MCGLTITSFFVRVLLLLACASTPFAVAQTLSDSPSSTDNPSTTMSSPTTITSGSATSAVLESSSSTSLPPTCSDTAAGCKEESQEFGHGASSYYFVFLAVIICAAGVATFLVWRKKRRARQWDHSGRESALASDLSAWDPAGQRRRYRQGRWRSAEASREEGLNEHGEAPPPYIPKSQEEDQVSREPTGAAGPAVPMQTLSREDAGLKPPDYTERHIQPPSRSTAAETDSSFGEHTDRGGTAHA
nr:hypothetical protein CFP56_74368 [Quercus suber]